MIGMSLISFLVLLAIAVVVAVVFHYVLRYRYLEGIDSFLAKIAVALLGGYLGFGEPLQRVLVEQVL